MHVLHCAVVSRSDRKTNQQCDEIFCHVFENYIAYRLVPTVMPVSHIIIKYKYR